MLNKAIRDVPSANSSERFRAIFDAVKDGIFIAEPATGRFIQVNGPGCAMFGYGGGELAGRDIELISSGIYPCTQDMVLEKAQRIQPEGPQTFEWQCKKKNGALFWTEMSLSLADMDDVSTLIIVTRDITERRQRDKKLLLAIKTMAAANDARTAFLANMSHELRTQLNGIVGFSDMMLSETLGPLGNARYREYIGDIHKSGQQLMALINDVLDLARLDDGKLDLSEEDVDLKSVVEEACRLARSQSAPPSPQIVNSVPQGLAHIRGDERRISQMLLNLLSNAMKFTPTSGRVTVTAVQSPNGIQLQVTDTGIGIAEADMKIVLERFGKIGNSNSQESTGAGLGLPLVKRLIELHGGALAIKSKLGAGTSVSLTFPAERLIRQDS